jgi:ribose 5-phosphate isomerase B
MKVFITSDHGGFEHKNQIGEFLRKEGFDVEDLGPHKLDPEDDYPDFVHKLTKKMISEGVPENKGIVVCRSATGVNIAANRTAGIRAATAWNETVAKHAREHNDSNVLCLSGDYVDLEENQKITLAWLREPYSGDERHTRRLKKIDQNYA